MSTKPPESAFWKLISGRMEAMSLTQKATARAIGVTKQTLQNWRTKPSIVPASQQLQELSKVLGLSLRSLYASLEQQRDEPLIPKAVWRDMARAYKGSALGRDMPANVARRLSRLPSRELVLLLMHTARREVERKGSASR